LFLELDRRLDIAMIDAFFSSGIGSLWGRFHAWMESVKIAIPFLGASASESTKRTLPSSRLLIAVRPSTSAENPSSLSITFNRGTYLAGPHAL